MCCISDGYRLNIHVFHYRIKLWPDSLPAVALQSISLMFPSLYLHVNQQRQASPSKCLCPPVSTTCAALVNHFFLQKRGFMWKKKTYCIWQALFQESMLKDVSCLVQATFQESIFFSTSIGRAINISATRPSYGYKAYLQLSWIISKSWRWCMTFITLWDRAN